MSAEFYYLDSSALVKLVASEPESRPLAAFMARRAARASSRVATVEVVRALHRKGTEPAGEVAAVFAALDLVELDEDIARVAAGLQPAGLRSLDAIHLASAMSLGPGLETFVSYDRRLADAAREAGLDVASPA